MGTPGYDCVVDDYSPKKVFLLTFVLAAIGWTFGDAHPDLMMQPSMFPDTSISNMFPEMQSNSIMNPNRYLKDYSSICPQSYGFPLCFPVNQMIPLPNIPPTMVKSIALCSFSVPYLKDWYFGDNSFMLQFAMNSLNQIITLNVQDGMSSGDKVVALNLGGIKFTMEGTFRSMYDPYGSGYSSYLPYLDDLKFYADIRDIDIDVLCANDAIDRMSEQLARQYIQDILDVLAERAKNIHNYMVSSLSGYPSQLMNYGQQTYNKLMNTPYSSYPSMNQLYPMLEQLYSNMPYYMSNGSMYMWYMMGKLNDFFYNHMSLLYKCPAANINLLC